MDMRETGFLKVMADYSFPEKQVVINPNDGFDLGLMTTEATVLLYVGHAIDDLLRDDQRPIYGRLYQKNECRLGFVEMSLKSVARMGEPKHVRLHLIPQDPYPKLLIAPE